MRRVISLFLAAVYTTILVLVFGLRATAPAVGGSVMAITFYLCRMWVNKIGRNAVSKKK